jgi:hypothetical protein
LFLTLKYLGESEKTPDGGKTNLQGQHQNAMASFRVSFNFLLLVARQL